MLDGLRFRHDSVAGIHQARDRPVVNARDVSYALPAAIDGHGRMIVLIERHPPEIQDVPDLQTLGKPLESIDKLRPCDLGADDERDHIDIVLDAERYPQLPADPLRLVLGDDGSAEHPSDRRVVNGLFWNRLAHDGGSCPVY